MTSNIAQFALLKNVSFHFTQNISELTTEIIQSYLQDKLEFVEFDGTNDFLMKMKESLKDDMSETNKLVDVINIHYDSKYVIQAVFVDNNSQNFNNIILFKRLINKNDSYTWYEFNLDPTVEIYTYKPITISEIATIIYQKNIMHGIIVHTDGSMKNIICSDLDKSEYGILSVINDGTKNELPYVNMVNILQSLTDKDLENDKFSHVLHAKIQHSNADYLYSQQNIQIGLLNCYYSLCDGEHNEVMTKIIGNDIKGDVIVCLENHLNEDKRMLPLNVQTFKNIVNYISKGKNTIKNNLFTNIFYETLQ